MVTTRVPATFGLMTQDSRKMKSYVVRYYITTWHSLPMKATSIDNLRKNIINELGTGYNEVFTDTKKPKHLGTLFMSLAPDHKWSWNVGNEFWNIDPKTGKIHKRRK